MKRLLGTSAAVSMAFWGVTPYPLFAQSLTAEGAVVAADGTILCEPTPEVPCVLEDYLTGAEPAAEPDAAAEAEAAAQAEAEAAAAAEAEAAAQAEADAAAAAEAEAAAQVEAEAEAAAAAEAEAAAQVEAEAAAQAEAAAAAEAEAAAQAQAEAEAAAQAEADAAAAAEAEAAAQAEAEAAAQAEADAAAQAEADAAAQAEADAAAQAEADAAAAVEAEAASQAEADAAAQAAAQAEAEAAAQAEADAAAAAQAEADAAAAAEADAAAAAEAEAEAAAQAAADAAAEAQAEAEAAAAAAASEQADAEAQAAADAAAAEAAIAAEAAAEAEAEAARAAEEAVTEEAIEEPATEEPATEEAVTEEPVEEPATEEVVTEDPVAEPAAEPEVQVLTEETTEVPVADEAAVEALGELLGATADPADETADRPAPVAEAGLIPLTPDAEATEGPTPEGIIEQVITEENTRSSDEEFRPAPEEARDGRRDSGLSDFEKVGLVALGALVVGAILNNGDEVVENTGDRVIVRNDAGEYYVYKDDDTLLRRPGSTVRTETYNDGSTRTIVLREDGSEVATIRDASGRVLRRATYAADGREIVLIDDFVEETYVDVSTLPEPRRERITISTADGDAALKAALAAEEAERLGRAFSLRQIREITEVRALAATVDVSAITFDSGSAAIKPTEAEKLADLGGLLTDLIAENPAEVFLIEGHTDAVGSASSNLALSDRRAESVALALTEYFDVPPENLVVQGYGEGELLVESEGDERANRRATVRVITPLMQTAAR